MQLATHAFVVLDDDSSLRGAIRHWGNRKGYRVYAAATEAEARSIVNEKPIDLAIVDVRLPDGDGVALAESLIEQDPERPVILMTAYADLDSARRAIGIGVFEFFAKPISFDDLERSVSRALLHRERLIENRLRRTSELADINADLQKEIDQRRATERALAEQARTLSEANERLRQKDRLLSAYQGIARAALSTLEMEEIVESVGRLLVEAGLSRRLMIALVDADTRQLEVVRQIRDDGTGGPDLIDALVGDRVSLSLDDNGITAAVARTGREEVVDDGPVPGSATFIPIKMEDRVLGVLGVGRPAGEREEMLRHVEAMRPMLDQIAFALDHARLYRSSRDHARVLSDVNAALEREMDERKRAEAAVVRLERLSALGEMSAGISHNLNNILTGILGPSDLIGQHTDEPRVLREVATIRHSARRARDLVKRLHESVRDEQEKVGSVDFDKTVAEAIETGRPRWQDEPAARGRYIRLTHSFNFGSEVAATGPGLTDMVVNLLFNAADALTSGGTIRVETDRAGDEAILRVTDDGIGMDDEVKRRVFEPFFTTKATVGTGLGLSAVYGQVTRWGGSIEVESAPGAGSTFEVRLPEWKGTVAGEEAEPEAASRPGRVLVVEDDAMVRDVVTRVLGRKHEVRAEADGTAGLAAMAPDTYDVALVDLGIPDVPGDQIAHRIREIDPSVTTVLMTGWTLAGDDPRNAVFDLRIQKPFESVARLTEVVERAIALKDSRESQG